MIFAAIGNLYYLGIYHFVYFYWHIILYSITIVNYDYRRKIKIRKKYIFKVHAIIESQNLSSSIFLVLKRLNKVKNNKKSPKIAR